MLISSWLLLVFSTDTSSLLATPIGGFLFLFVCLMGKKEYGNRINRSHKQLVLFSIRIFRVFPRCGLPLHMLLWFLKT